MTTAKPGILYIVPTPLGKDASFSTILPTQRELLAQVSVIITEHAKTTRAFLKRLHITTPWSAFTVFELGGKHKNLRREELFFHLDPIFQEHRGERFALFSEVGCPGVADPGAEVVLFAHQYKMRVIPLVGPSALLLTLMASGLPGQQFAFHGYLPIGKKERIQQIRLLDRQSRQQGQTQLVIETPYRTEQLFAALLANLAPTTLLCVATDITTQNECITTKSIAAWRASGQPQLDRRQVVFAFCGE